MEKKKQKWFEVEQRDLVDDVRSLNAAHSVVLNRQGNPIILNRRAGSLVSVVTFMFRVIRTTDVAFEIVEQNGKKKSVPASTLSEYFSAPGAMAQLYSRRSRHSPPVQLFFDCFAAHDICRCTLAGPDRQFEDGSRIEAEVFVDFINTLREQGTRVGIVKQLNDWNNASDDNDKSVRRYVDALFERNGALLPVHLELWSIDCSIDEERVDEIVNMVEEERAKDMAALRARAGEEAKSSGLEGHHDASAVVADRDRLLDNMRAKPAIFRNLAGYVWRIEWSYTGFYLRVVFFFDDTEPHTAEWLGELIGRYWVDAITKGKGTYRNLNICSTKFAGVGKVHSKDAAKRVNLVQVLRRLARRDRYICVDPRVKCNRFGMGRLPKRKMSKEAQAMRRSRLKQRNALAPEWVHAAVVDVRNSSFPFGPTGYRLPL